MRSPAIGFSPFLFTRQEGRRLHKLFYRNQVFERRKPMVVITGTVIGFAAPVCLGELFGERRDPLAPCEESVLRQLDSEREGVGLPRLGENRLPFIAPQGRERCRVWHWLKRARDSLPRDRDRRCRGPQRPLPKACVPKTVPNKGAAVARL